MDVVYSYKMYVKMNRLRGLFYEFFSSVGYAQIVILNMRNKPYLSLSTCTGAINTRH